MHEAWFALGGAMLWFGSSAFAQGVDLPTAAVVGFSSTQGARHAGFRENFEEILSINLANIGKFRVLERSKLHEVVGEQALSSTMLADDHQSLVRIGKLLGADYLMTGSLLAFDVQTNKFTGYGVESTICSYTVRVSAKLVDANTGQIVFGDLVESRGNEQQLPSPGTFDGGIQHQLLSECCTKLVSDIDVFASAHETELARRRDGTQLVEVHFESQPPGANILVDGAMIGNAPFTYKASEGIHRVTMALGGFVTWEQMVRLANGQRVKATLQKPPEKKPNVLVIIP